jgi:hypothetical protein
MTPAQVTSDVQNGNGSSAGSAIVILGSVLIALLLLLVVIAFGMTVYRFPYLSRFRDADLLVQLFANLVVAFYAFPSIQTNEEARVPRARLRGLNFCVYGAFSCSGVGVPIAGFAITDAVVLCRDPCFRHCRVVFVRLWRCIIGAISRSL